MNNFTFNRRPLSYDGKYYSDILLNGFVVGLLFEHDAAEGRFEAGFTVAMPDGPEPYKWI